MCDHQSPRLGYYTCFANCSCFIFNRSLIGYWHHAVRLSIRLPVHLSVALCIDAKWYILQQVNSKCPLRALFYNFQPPYADPIPSVPPPLALLMLPFGKYIRNAFTYLHLFTFGPLLDILGECLLFHVRHTVELHHMIGFISATAALIVCIAVRW